MLLPHRDEQVRPFTLGRLALNLLAVVALVLLAGYGTAVLLALG